MHLGIAALRRQIDMIRPGPCPRLQSSRDLAPQASLPVLAHAPSPMNRKQLKFREEVVIRSRTVLAVLADIGLLVPVEPDISTRPAIASTPTDWLASPSPAIFGTYGAGISRLYSLSQSTSANHPWAKMSEEPARKLPYRFDRSPTSRFLSSSFARASKYVGYRTLPAIIYFQHPSLLRRIGLTFSYSFMGLPSSVKKGG